MEITKFFSSEKLLKNSFLNFCGIHLLRIFIARIFYYTRQKIQVPKHLVHQKDKLNKDGYILIENFLNIDDFSKILTEVEKIKSIHGDIPIFAIETTPTISRWSVWDKISKTNDLIKDYTEKKGNLNYITTRLDFLDSKGYPREKYFVNDNLHLNKSGYKLWSKIIKNNFRKKL